MCSTMQQRSSARKHVLLASMHKKDAEVGSIHSSAADGQQYEKMPQKWKPKRPREVAGRKAKEESSLSPLTFERISPGQGRLQLPVITSRRPWTSLSRENPRDIRTKIRPVTTGTVRRLSSGSLKSINSLESTRMPSAKPVGTGPGGPVNDGETHWTNVPFKSYKHAGYLDMSRMASEAKGNNREIWRGSASSERTRPRQKAAPRLTSVTKSAGGLRGTLQPWSVTELLESRDARTQQMGQEVPPPGDEEEFPEDDVSYSSSEEEQPDPVKVQHRRRQVANRLASLMTWTEGPVLNSDEYDTDLEEDFPPEAEPTLDATGACFYQDRCKSKGIVPASYLLRNLGEGNLRMRHHYLGGSGTKPLAQALKRNTVCEELDLTDNYLEGQGAAALANTLKENMFIVNLNISNNFIRSEGAEALAEMLEANTTLKTLSLQGNQLCDQDARRIAEALKNNMSLSCLDLSHNEFCEIGGLFLAQGIAANIGLVDLDLSWNCIREKGAVAIAKAVAKNSTLEILDLSWNGLSYTGTMALASALKVNKTLKVLDISNNRLNPEGAKYLGKCLAKNQGLETLLMGLNPIGSDGVESILKATRGHPRLKLLGIENTVDLSVYPAQLSLVKQIQESRDLMIMATIGPQQQSRINATVLAVFDRFLTENSDSMEDLFNQMDKDKSGDVTLEELKYGLKDFGLRLTSKQLDMLLDELDADKSGTIEYTELMQGVALIKREKQKMERAAAEMLRYKDNTNNSRGNQDVTVK